MEPDCRYGLRRGRPDIRSCRKSDVGPEPGPHRLTGAVVRMRNVRTPDRRRQLMELNALLVRPLGRDGRAVSAGCGFLKPRIQKVIETNEFKVGQPQGRPTVRCRRYLHS